MSVKIVAVAVQSDADVCNALQLPVQGCSGGHGFHIFIPPDFLVRVTAGQDVPGCTYHRVEGDGSLTVSDRVQVQIAIPAVVNALSPALQTAAAALITKLATAVVVTAQVEGP